MAEEDACSWRRQLPATLRFELTSGTEVTAGVLWTLTGQVIPAFTRDERVAALAVLTCRHEGGEVAVTTVTLKDDPGVSALVHMDRSGEMHTDSTTLAEWAAKHLPTLQ